MVQKASKKEMRNPEVGKNLLPDQASGAGGSEYDSVSESESSEDR